MQQLIGKRIQISGMLLQVVSDAGDRWETRNITTQETVFIDKSVLQKAIKLAMAEVISEFDESI